MATANKRHSGRKSSSGRCVLRCLALLVPIPLSSLNNMVLTDVIFSCHEQDMAQHCGAATLLLVMSILSISALVRVLSGGAGVQGLKNGLGGVPP